VNARESNPNQPLRPKTATPINCHLPLSTPQRYNLFLEMQTVLKKTHLVICAEKYCYVSVWFFMHIFSIKFMHKYMFYEKNVIVSNAVGKHIFHVLKNRLIFFFLTVYIAKAKSFSTMWKTFFVSGLTLLLSTCYDIKCAVFPYKAWKTFCFF
jgi:hypothetical protein